MPCAIDQGHPDAGPQGKESEGVEFREGPQETDWGGGVYLRRNVLDCLAVLFEDVDAHHRFVELFVGRLVDLEVLFVSVPHLLQPLDHEEEEGRQVLRGGGGHKDVGKALLHGPGHGHSFETKKHKAERGPRGGGTTTGPDATHPPNYLSKLRGGGAGAGQFSLETLVGGRPGTAIFQNPGGGGGGLGGGGGGGGVAYKDPARPPPRRGGCRRICFVPPARPLSVVVDQFESGRWGPDRRKGSRPAPPPPPHTNASSQTTPDVSTHSATSRTQHNTSQDRSGTHQNTHQHRKPARQVR